MTKCKANSTGNGRTRPPTGFTILIPIPGLSIPPFLTVPITPANLLKTLLPSLTTHTSLNPARHLSIPGPGSRIPVNTTTASSSPAPPKKCTSVPSGSVDSSTPSVVIFSPISPAESGFASAPAAAESLPESSRSVSTGTRCTCLRFGVCCACAWARC